VLGRTGSGVIPKARAWKRTNKYFRKPTVTEYGDEALIGTIRNVALPGKVNRREANWRVRGCASHHPPTMVGPTLAKANGRGEMIRVYLPNVGYVISSTMQQIGPVIDNTKQRRIAGVLLANKE
jgi:hypothetical protein